MSDQTKKKPRYPATPDAPEFQAHRWQLMQNDDGELNVRGLTLMSNCYQYAVAGSKLDGSNMLYHEAIPNPGELGGRLGILYTREGLREAVENDGLTVAPFTISKSTNSAPLPKIKAGYYLVGMYVKNVPPSVEDPNGSRDYHFVRQDSDGGWSHKPGQGMRIQVSRFLEPDTDGSYRALPTRFGDGKNYKFAGYAYVPRQGIDAGPEQPLIRALLAANAINEDKCFPANMLFNRRLPEAPNDPSYPYQYEQAVNIGISMRKYGIREAVDIYDACLDEYVRNLRKPLKSSELQIDAR